MQSPRLFFHRIRRRWYDFRHPGDPWLTPGAIRYLEAALTRDMSGLEWGSGRSTVWLARRLGRLISVEHNPEWHARVASWLEREGLRNVDQRLERIPAEREAYDASYWADPPPPYVAVALEVPDKSLDFVLIDGAYRQACTLRVLPKIRSGGILAIDNARTLPALQDWRVPSDWPIEFLDRRRLFDTVLWRKP